MEERMVEKPLYLPPNFDNPILVRKLKTSLSLTNGWAM